MKHRPDGQLISRIEEGSIAADLGVRPGDRLLLLDHEPVDDIFDYRLRELNRHLLLTIRQCEGETVEFDIEKDEDEELGLVFAESLLDEYMACSNRCVFCFIDQLPPGLRASLYFKDDDYRLSFLSGNYVTLTNLDDAGLARLIRNRLSPVNVSVHATDPLLRRKMLRHKAAGQIMSQLLAIAAANLKINAQIVLCPGLNDGSALRQTLADLAGLGEPVQSIAIVPVGLTRYRDLNRLPELRALTAADAAAVLDEVASWQARMLVERQTRLVYAADEIYLRAGRDVPPADGYEDFPQLENGVGMIALFRADLAAGFGQSLSEASHVPLLSAWPQGWTDEQTHPARVILVTGTAAAPLLASFAGQLSSWSGIGVEPAAIANRFFGEQVTVAGLLTGRDLIGQLEPLLANCSQVQPKPHLILPACLLKSGESILLDGVSVDDIARELNLPVHVCPADAAGLLGVLAWLAGRAERSALA